MSDQPYEVADAVDSLVSQLGSTATRAAVAEARVKGLEKRIAGLEEQLEQALVTLTELAPKAPPEVIDAEPA